MAFAGQRFDVDDGLAILTEMIVSEIGPRDALAGGKSRAAAVARVERLLQAFLLDDSSGAQIELREDLEGDILFGRGDAEFLFAQTREPE